MPTLRLLRNSSLRLEKLFNRFLNCPTLLFLHKNDLECSGEERRSLRLGDSQFNQHYAELQRAINVSLGRVNPDLLMRKIETKIDGKGGKKYFAEAALEGSSEE